RVIVPTRPQVGDRIAVRLAASLAPGSAGRGLGLAELTEALPGGRHIQLTVGALAPGERAEVTYAMPAAVRGRHQLGPAILSVVDPLGLAARTMIVGAPMDVIVRPVVH